MVDEILQLCPFSAYLEEGLASRFKVHRWFETQNPERWLESHGAGVRGVVTGGHIGIENGLMDKLPNLGVVAINGVGFDKVDLNHARQRTIRVSYTPNVLTDDVADLAVGLTINLLRGIGAGGRFITAGSWLKGDLPLGTKVTGRRFGIVGLGRIGQAIATRLSSFGSLAYTDLAPKDVPYEYHGTLLELAGACDVLIVAASADPSTRRLIGRAVFEALGPKGYIVNVARGSLLAEDELLAALREGLIAGAALDVFTDEPRVPPELVDQPNVVVTPHIASGTVETRQEMARVVLANLDAYFAGTTMPSALV